MIYLKDYEIGPENHNWPRFIKRLNKINSEVAENTWEAVSPKQIQRRLDQIRIGMEARGLRKAAMRGMQARFDVPFGNDKSLRVRAERDEEGWRILEMSPVDGRGDSSQLDVTKRQAGILAAEALRGLLVNGGSISQGRLQTAFTAALVPINGS